MPIINNQLFSDKGSSLIGALIILLIVGFTGATLVTMSSGNNAGSVNEMQTQQAFYGGHAGLEMARHDLYNGQNPVVVGQPLGTGALSISTTPSQGLVTVSSQVGQAKKTQTINANFGKDCVLLDTTQAAISNINDHDLTGILLTKSCNAAAIASKMYVTWNWDSCVLNSDYATDDLSTCPVDTGGALVDGITLASTTIYDSLNNIGSPVGAGANAGEMIDVLDYTMSSNAGYLFDKIHFSQSIPNGALTTVTVEFADLSQVTGTFQTKTETEADPGFTVDTGRIEVDENHSVNLQVLCSQITYGSGGPEIPVKVRVKINGTWIWLWGYQDVDGGETYSATTGIDADTFILEAYARYGSWRKTYNSTNTRQVKTLLNNDIPPALAGFGGQQPVSACIADYLDPTTGKVVLNGNQAIMLFELGVDMAYNPNSPAADFQDLVVLWEIN